MYVLNEDHTRLWSPTVLVIKTTGEKELHYLGRVGNEDQYVVRCCA